MAKGGSREGSGRKQKWGEPATHARVPKSIPSRQIDGMINIIMFLKDHGVYRADMSADEIIETYRNTRNP